VNRTEPLVPEYGRACLTEVVPSIAAAQGVPGWVGALALPASPRWVLLMVDGLGAHNLAASADVAPYLSALAGRASALTLTSGAPSTTATSLTSIGTGLAPGQHGIVGYSFRHPFTGGLLNALVWEEGLSGLDVQPRLTAFERLARQGVAVTSVSPARFEGSGLTVAGLRGARFVPVPDEQDLPARLGWAADAARSGDRSLVYVYERSLDSTGHATGWRSEVWREALARVDAFARALRDALPDDARLLVTGDHGMVDCPPERWLVAEDVPGLLSEVELLAGEGRLRQLYAPARRVRAVARRWASVLGERAWVVTREEAIHAGWFGAVDPRLAGRIGDVLVVLRDDWAVMTRAHPREFGLVGMHGSLTDAEMRVPLLVD